MELRVKANKDKLIWKEDFEIKANTKVTAEGGVHVLFIHNGAVYKTVLPGQTEVINQKGFFEKLFTKKDNKNFEVYGVNTNKVIELKWGTIKNPDYKDEEYGVVLQAKCYGISRVRIENPQRLYDALDEKEDFTEEKLNEIIKKYLCTICAEALTEIAMQKKNRFAIQASNSEVAKLISNKFENSFGELYGLICDDTTVLEITVEGFELLDKKTISLEEAKIDSKCSDEKAHQAMNEVKVINELAKGQSVNNVAPQPSTTEGEKRKNYKFCPNCGEQLKLDDRFCPNCGSTQNR